MAAGRVRWSYEKAHAGGFLFGCLTVPKSDADFYKGGQLFNPCIASINGQALTTLIRGCSSAT